MDRLTAAIATALLVGPAEADAPRILTDIAPIYSLVTLVVGDKAKVELMLDKGQDPPLFSAAPLASPRFVAKRSDHLDRAPNAALDEKFNRDL